MSMGICEHSEVAFKQLDNSKRLSDYDCKTM